MIFSSRKVLEEKVEVIQKVLVDLIDEFKDEIPTILRPSQSKQKKKPVPKTSQARKFLRTVKINRGTLIQGLTSISCSSKSVARLLQPQLASRLLELRSMSYHLLREVNAPKSPPHAVQARKSSLLAIISFPAKAVLTSIMYASYAALIYLAIAVNALLEKIKNIFQEEESIRQHGESENFWKSFSELVLSEPMFPEGEIKPKPYRSLPEKPDSSAPHAQLPANAQPGNKIQVLHSVFDHPPE
uniref:spermatogenesis-associated protein 9 isoform X1 n=1 Tax=Jaculus jaculus TaxID=51337 RepID=UPI001E1AFFBF|nr:spermatogenesis-associated protein 9 isoform X1 [Jaculus jaculus]XP_044989203.1 spermatogenesis-associated protein 9 isoform X1 [Jaculus jaculus]XP_044989204.1 spermatogenesis-associated protein 9 isoform X1 [Jaculus jaculus]